MSSTPTLPTLTAEQQKYVTYTITYDEGGALTGNDPLNHGQTKTVKVRLEFKKDITELPTDLGTLNLNFAMKYVQK